MGLTKGRILKSESLSKWKHTGSHPQKKRVFTPKPFFIGFWGPFGNVYIVHGSLPGFAGLTKGLLETKDS